MSDLLFNCLFEELDSTEPFVQMYWAYGEHLGDALEKMREAAFENGFRRPQWAEADPYDPAQPVSAEVEYSDDERVFWVRDRVYFDAGDSAGMALPYGIIPSFRKIEYEPEDIAPGYTVSQSDDLYHFELNVPDDRLRDDYAMMLSSIEPFNVFWYRLHAETPQHESDLLYINEMMHSAEDIDQHLYHNRDHSLRNGFVTLTAFAPEGATNVNLTDHKKIVVLTHSEDMLHRAELTARQLGYRHLHPYISIDHGFHHWHFRSPQSLPREQLVQYLSAQGFHPWDGT